MVDRLNRLLLGLVATFFILLFGIQYLFGLLTKWGFEPSASLAISVAVFSIFIPIMLAGFGALNNFGAIELQITLDSIKRVQDSEEKLLEYRHGMRSKTGKVNMNKKQELRLKELEHLLLNSLETYCTLVNNGYVETKVLRENFDGAIVLWYKMLKQDFPLDEADCKKFPELKKKYCEISKAKAC